MTRPLAIRVTLRAARQIRSAKDWWREHGDDTAVNEAIEWAAWQSPDLS